MENEKYEELWKEAQGEKFRVVVNVSTEDAINGYSFDRNERILPSDLCFTLEGQIVFANTIIPIGSELNLELKQKLLTSGVTNRFYGIIKKPEHVFKLIDEVNAKPYYNEDEKLFIYEFEGKFYYNNKCLDEFYLDTTVKPIRIKTDKLYILDNKLYMYDINTKGLKNISFKPRVEKLFNSDKYTLIFE